MVASGARLAVAPRGRCRGALARLATAAGTIAVALLVTAPAASAHTVFNGSNPADGSVVAVAPAQVELDFNQDVDPRLTQVQLADAAGHSFAGLTATADPTHPNRLLVAVPPLAKQTYRLSFQTRDPVDLHLTASSIVFGVGTAPTLAATRPAIPGPDWTETVLRWVSRLGLSLAIGALLVALLVAPKALARSRLAAIQAPLFGMALAGVIAAVVGDTAVLALQASRIGSLGSWFGRVVFQSDFGRRWLVGIQIVAGSVLVLAWLRGKARRGVSTLALRKRGWRGRLHPMVAAGVILVAAQAVAVATSGHVTEVSLPKSIGVALLSAHLLAVGAWIGALLALVTTLGRVTGSQSGDGSVRGLLEAFSPFAAAGLVVVVVSGFLLSGSQVATVTALLSSPYGVILLAKVAVVAVAAGFGAYHYRQLRHPRAAGRRATTTLMAEAVLGAIVILGGAALATAAPALGPQFRATTAVPGPSVLTTSAGDLVVRVSLRPNRPGPNLLAVDVFNTRRPAPAPIGAVRVSLSGVAVDSQVVTATPSGTDHYDGGTVSLKPGPLNVAFSVLRPGQPVAAGQLPWSVNGPEPYRAPTVISTARLAPITTAAAGIVVALALGCFGLSRWRRRQTRPPGPATPRPSEPVSSDPASDGTAADAATGSPVDIRSRSPV